MKTGMSSFDVAALVPEVNRAVKGARIDNIYQTSHNTLLFKLRYRDQPPLHLIMEAGKRFHLTVYPLKRLRSPPGFCMALRKHLKNGRVAGLQQHEFERTVVVRVERKEGEFQLVLELFGDGNLILVSPQNVILQALVYRRMRDRNVWRGEAFQFAPPSGRNPLQLSLQDLAEIKTLGDLEVVRALTKFLSIGGLYSEEILLRAQVDKGKPCRSLTEGELHRIFQHLSQMLSTVTAGETEPSVVLDGEGGWVDVTPIPLKKHNGLAWKRYETFNEALDEYYTKAGVEEGAAEATQEVERELAKQERILQRQQEALKDLRAKVEKNRRIGDLIYRHLQELQNLLKRVMEEKRAGKPWGEVTLNLLREKEEGRIPAVHFHSLKPERLLLNVAIEDVAFPLDLRRSVQASAARCYEGAKKAEKKIRGAEKALRETEARIRELRRQRDERVRERPEAPPRRRRRAWYEKFRWFRSSDGFLVIGGRDATTNEVLIKRHMEPHDQVLHADIHGAPFVLIKTTGKSPPETTVKEAAQLASSYSRAWREGLGAVDVYWVLPQQVSRSPPSGQYLRKGSFMISGTRNYVRNVPLRVAVGIKEEEEYLLVVGGPPEAVANQASVSVEITQGRKNSGELAKQIRGLLAERAPENLRRRILRIPLEEIQGFIPPGGGAVAQRANSRH